MGIVALEGFGGGGGASLNFDIKAYATEELLLTATPKENTIGIITTTPITSWIFSATEPENPEPGMVWIFTGTSSGVEFNALKKHGIQVYPISAKQHIDGALVDVVAKSRQGGVWVDWIVYLFRSGEGSKISFVTEHGSSNAYSNFTNDYIEVGWTLRNAIETTIKSEEPIKLDDYAMLRLVGKIDANAYADPIRLCIIDEANNTISMVTTDVIGAFELSIPISSVTGSHYPAIINSSQRSYIYDWWLE